MQHILKKKDVKRGLIAFISLSIIGLTTLFTLTDSSQTFTSIQLMQFRYLVIVIGLAILDIWLSGLRYYVLIKNINCKVTAWLCIKANLSDILMSAITPFQTGGGPALLYIFHRGGVPIEIGLAACVLSFMMTLIFLLCSSCIVILFLNIEFSIGALDYLVYYGFFAFVFNLLLFTFSIWHPDAIGRVISKIASRFIRKSQERINTFTTKLTNKLIKYKETCSLYFRQPHILASAFILTILIFLTKFSLAYFIVLGLSVRVDYIIIVAIQTLVYFLPYFSPTPGGSCFAELSIAGLMTICLPNSELLIFTFLHRFFLLYVPVGLGAIVLLAELKKLTVDN